MQVICSSLLLVMIAHQALIDVLQPVYRQCKSRVPSQAKRLMKTRSLPLHVLKWLCTCVLYWCVAVCGWSPRDVPHAHQRGRQAADPRGEPLTPSPRQASVWGNAEEGAVGGSGCGDWSVMCSVLCVLHQVLEGVPAQECVEAFVAQHGVGSSNVDSVLQEVPHHT